MTQYANTAEGGTSGTTVTTANSGGASGDAWDTVTIDPTCTVAFDNAHAAHGSLSYKIATGGTAGVAQLEKVFPGAVLTMATRFYMYLTANPGGNNTPVLLLNGTTIRAWISVNSAGKLFARDAGGGAVITHTGSVPLNQWFRVEAQWPSLSNTVGQVTLSRYDTPDSATPSETLTSSASAGFGGAADRIRYGSLQAGSGIGPYWLDDIAENDTGTAIGSAVTLVTTPRPRPLILGQAVARSVM